jgi:Uma2 family endonuclease
MNSETKGNNTMTVATDKRRSHNIDPRRMALVEYLAYDDGTDIRHELVNGELVAMSVETGKHGAIAEFINDVFKAEINRSNLPWTSKDDACLGVSLCQEKLKSHASQW